MTNFGKYAISDCPFIQLFKWIFSFLQFQRTLDYNSLVHMFCKHFVYLPRINKALLDFMRAWNSHSVSGCGNISPNQMVMADLFQNFRALDVDNSSIAPNYNDILADKDMYGIDQQNPTSYCNQGDKESGGLPSATRMTVTPFDFGPSGIPKRY